MAVKSVEEYIESLNESGKKYVQEFVEFMNNEYPQLNHKICFSIPMWLNGTKMTEGYVGISGAKNHFSIHFSDEDYVCKLGEQLLSCKTGRRCINIKYGDDNAFDVVKEGVKSFLEVLQ